MTLTDLRPRSASELVDTSFRLLRRHYGAFLALSAVASIPTVLFQLAQLALVGAVDLAVSPFAFWIGVALAVPYYGLTESCFVSLASDAYRDGEARLGDAVRRGARRALPVAAGFVLVWIPVMLGVILLIVPGLFLLSRLYTTTPAIVLDGAGPLAGVRRTWGRTRGRAAHVLGTLALTFLLYFVLYFGVTLVAGVAGAFGSPLAGVAVGALVQVLVYPMLPIVSTLLYYDLRIRGEGYDLEVMAERLGAPPAGVPGVPTPG